MPIKRSGYFLAAILQLLLYRWFPFCLWVVLPWLVWYYGSTLIERSGGHESPQNLKYGMCSCWLCSNLAVFMCHKWQYRDSAINKKNCSSFSHICYMQVTVSKGMQAVKLFQQSHQF